MTQGPNRNTLQQSAGVEHGGLKIPPRVQPQPSCGGLGAGRRAAIDLRLGESGDVLRTLDGEIVDALVTDPPAGIGFMGRAWDGDKGGRRQWIAWLASIMDEAYRVLRPGAHGLVWALPRTSHWTATALEDAGFEIRDVGVHLFGTGFPKSLNIGDGRGTALKPAAEHWILCRKPLDGTVAGNVARHGTGALNIDACRIGTEKDWPQSKSYTRGSMVGGDRNGIYQEQDQATRSAAGRWPANLTLDEEAAALLDAQSGELVSGFMAAGTIRNQRTSVAMGRMTDNAASRDTFADSGGASRFFYVAKPDRAERDIGCEGLPAASGGEATGRMDGSAGTQNPRAGAGRSGGARNIHPTVKPVDLMRWLCRLITPKGGLVLDPFMGSGTTGIACAREGFRFLGIEREAQYMEIARRRIVGDAPLLNAVGAP